MMNSSTIESLAEKLAKTLPPGGQALAEDIRKNLRLGLASALDRMDLVTREEFDIQKELLARTRARLEQLEKQVAELEAARDR